MQNWSLQRKIQVTCTRIMEWYIRFHDDVYVSFSGGKDSTVLLDLARRAYPEISAAFVDTGLEYPELKVFVKTYQNVDTIRPKMPFKLVIEKYGYPVISKEQSFRIRKLRNQNLTDDYREKQTIKLGKKWAKMLKAPFECSEQCCDVMKKRPLKKYEKETGKHPIVGTMASEGFMRKQLWLKNGCNAFNNTRPTSQPMSFWSDQDVLAYLVLTKTKYAHQVYGSINCKYSGAEISRNNVRALYKQNPDILKEISFSTSGVNRTGCMFCMFGCHLEKEPNRFQRMKISHPKLYDYCIRSVEENGLGCGKVLDYIGVKYQ